LGRAANLGSNRRALTVLGLAVGFVAAVILISMGISALSH
jgi:tetrahydromethanopterin S-methyltransferase subunit F